MALFGGNFNVRAARAFSAAMNVSTEIPAESSRF
jgi:hypothetical protein